MVGYGTIDCIIGGQILSAVSGGSMSIVVGIIIVALVSWIVAAFGLAVFHVYERYSILLDADVRNQFNTDRKQMGMAPSTHCTVCSCRFCRLKFQFLYSIRWKPGINQRQSTLIFFTFSLRSRFMGRCCL